MGLTTTVAESDLNLSGDVEFRRSGLSRSRYSRSRL
jgi:hypothetical protein